MLLIISCSNDELNDTINISGTSQDIFRNTNSSNLKVILYEKHSYNNFPYNTNTYGVKVDSAISDVNGRFELNYRVKNNVKHFVTFSNNSLNNMQYKIEVINKEEYENYENRIYVNKGIENVINVNSYIPNILKVNVNVSNNFNNQLSSHSSFQSNQPYDWNRKVYIKSTNIDTLFYLSSRPNSDMKVYFLYNPTPNDIHSNPNSKIFYLNSNTNDTISVSYSIDCDTF